eukprot:8975470-Ditylum_brightwellii.AAC.1
MEARDNNINETIQKLDYADEIMQKNPPPSAIKSLLQQILVTKGGGNSVTFGVEVPNTHDATSHGVTFSSLDKDDKTEEK